MNHFEMFFWGDAVVLKLSETLLYEDDDKMFERINDDTSLVLLDGILTSFLNHMLARRPSG